MLNRRVSNGLTFVVIAVVLAFTLWFFLPHLVATKAHITRSTDIDTLQYKPDPSNGVGEQSAELKDSTACDACETDVVGQSIHVVPKESGLPSTPVSMFSQERQAADLPGGLSLCAEDTRAECNRRFLDYLNSDESLLCEDGLHPVSCMMLHERIIGYDKEFAVAAAAHPLACGDKKAMHDLIRATQRFSHLRLADGTQPLAEKLGMILSKDPSCAGKLSEYVSGEEWPGFVEAVGSSLGTEGLSRENDSSLAFKALVGDVALWEFFQNALPVCGIQGDAKIEFIGLNEPFEFAGSLQIMGSDPGAEIKLKTVNLWGYGRGDAVYQVPQGGHGRCFWVSRKQFLWAHEMQSVFEPLPESHPLRSNLLREAKRAGFHEVQTATCKGGEHISSATLHGEEFVKVESTCSEWRGEGLDYSQSFYVFRRAKDELSLLCSNAACSGEAGGVVEFDEWPVVMDLDKDGNPELMLRSSAGLSSHVRAVEIEKGNGRIVAEILTNSEGELMEYPPHRLTVLTKAPATKPHSVPVAKGTEFDTSILVPISYRTVPVDLLDVKVAGSMRSCKSLHGRLLEDAEEGQDLLIVEQRCRNSDGAVLGYLLKSNGEHVAAFEPVYGDLDIYISDYDGDGHDDLLFADYHVEKLVAVLRYDSTTRAFRVSPVPSVTAEEYIESRRNGAARFAVKFDWSRIALSPPGTESWLVSRVNPDEPITLAAGTKTFRIKPYGSAQ